MTVPGNIVSVYQILRLGIKTTEIMAAAVWAYMTYNGGRISFLPY